MEKTINFRISEETKLELQVIADEREIKVSHLIRAIITDFIEDYYDVPDPIIMYSQTPIEVILDVPNSDHFNQ
ncbi:hypothetical protein [Polaribacter sp. R77954]|jgi:hypothetical protein|uniref:hypothetical protein n=1 Tax=Polaribacter sp. R77954 TaxID=3093870 RepID=UPI0037CAE004